MRGPSQRLDPTPTTSADATAIDALRGTFVGRYRLCFEVGHGGMAVVYLARAEGPAGFDKLVALKCIHPHLAREPGFVEMFLDEARIASRIHHPNVCGVFDFGEQDGTYFMAMEYLMGETTSGLRRAIWKDKERAGSRRVQALVAKVLADACEGLHAAHELADDVDGTPLGLVHRDVSPGNLVVTYDGGVRVMDFGIARAAGGVHHTATGVVKGKMAYMAPEQARAQPVDRRADVWSMGVVLWEIVTGHRLFRRHVDAETVLAVVSQPVLPPSSAESRVSPELDRIALAALERDPARRPASARELGRELARFAAEHGPVVAGDVADWMGELFAEERARKQQTVRIARQLGAPTVPRAMTETGPASAGSSDVGWDVTIPDASAPTPARRVRSRPWVLGAGLGVALAAVAATAVLQGAWSEREPPAAAGTPAPPARTPVPERVAAAAREPAAGIAEAPAEARVEQADGDSPRAPTGGSPRRAPVPADKRPPRRADRATSAPTGVPAAPGRSGAADLPGTVTVVTPGGWADVYLGARLLGRTPNRFTLPAGTHVLRLVPFGDRPARTASTTVAAGGAQRVIVRLDGPAH